MSLEDLMLTLGLWLVGLVLLLGIVLGLGGATWIMWEWGWRLACVQGGAL